jgi:hypothetical protein
MGAGRSDAPHESRAALARACAALKIFPLPGVVVLPGAPAPFRLFEPRYRALGAAVLAGDRVLAVATLLDPSQAPEPRAPVRPVAGVGRVVAEEQNPDGTIDIMLQVEGRVRLVEELTGQTPYRVFRAELLEDAYPADGAATMQGDLEAIGQLCYELAGLLPAQSGADQLAQAVARSHAPGAMADLVAAAAIGEVEARYQVLAAVDVARRLDVVKQALAGVILMLSRGQPPGA